MCYDFIFLHFLSIVFPLCLSLLTIQTTLAQCIYNPVTLLVLVNYMLSRQIN